MKEILHHSMRISFKNEGEVVYLIDEENKVLSSNKEDEIGSYIDGKNYRM